MRQRDLQIKMDVRELMEWMAYDMACDSEFREKVLVEQSLEAQKSNTGEQEAQLIKNMFTGMANASN